VVNHESLNVAFGIMIGYEHNHKCT